MERIIAAQGARERQLVPGPLWHEVKAAHAGRIAAIDCERIARVARHAGAPMDKAAGIDLLVKVGGVVRAGDVLYSIHASTQTGLDFARDLAREDPGYAIA